MRLRPLLLISLLIVVPGMVAAEEKTKSPTLTLRVQALDELMANVRYLAEQTGRGEEATQFEKLLKAMTGDKGLEGLDPKKPMGLYAFVGAQGIDSKVVLLLPIADQKMFMDTLARLRIRPDKPKGDVYEVQPAGSPFPVYFRFVHGYVYATMRESDTITDKKLLKPETVLPRGEKDAVSLTLDLSEFPKELRNVIIGQLELRLADLEEKKEGETKAQHAFRVSTLKEGVALLKSLLTDSDAVSFRFAVDREAGDVSLSMSLSGKESSELTKTIASLGERKSAVAALVGNDSALRTRITYELPEKLRKDLAPVIDEGLSKLLDETKEQGVKELIKPLLDAVAPTLKQARVDGAVDFRGPSEQKQYTIVGAVGVKDGLAIEKEIKAALNKLPAEVKEKVSVDVARAGTVNIHRLNIEKDLDAEARKNLGENPIYFALRDDAAFFALGENGLAAIKEAVGVKARGGPVMQMDLSLQRLAPLMEKDQKFAPKAAQEAFGKNRNSDKVSISLDGGKEVRLRLTMKGAVLRFYHLLEKSEKGEEKKDQ